MLQAVVANMISIFCKMTPRHYDQYIEHFRADKPAGRCDLVIIHFNCKKDLYSGDVVKTTASNCYETTLSGQVMHNKTPLKRGRALFTTLTFCNNNSNYSLSLNTRI